MLVELAITERRSWKTIVRGLRSDGLGRPSYGACGATVLEDHRTGLRSDGGERRSWKACGFGWGADGDRRRSGEADVWTHPNRTGRSEMGTRPGPMRCAENGWGSDAGPGNFVQSEGQGKEYRQATMTQTPKVALLIETARGYGRQMLRGIARYAHLHGPWGFYVTPGDFEQALPKMRQWGGTGIIADRNAARCAGDSRFGVAGDCSGFG